MPIKSCQINNEKGYKWGDRGKCYAYDPSSEESKADAKKKAIAQGVASGDLEAVGAQLNILKGSYKFEKLRKIGFDWDETASTKRGKELIKRFLDEGNDVYIITARDSKAGIAVEGILPSRIYAVGSNEEKIKKVKELNIVEFYDNNKDVISKLPKVGKVFTMVKKKKTMWNFPPVNIEFESYNDYPKAAIENAKIALRWAEENGWGSCGTPVGKARANQLANGENISEDTIARMAAFERHRQNSQKELGDGCGRLMWLAWGGDEGIEWASRKLKEIRG